MPCWPLLYVRRLDQLLRRRLYRNTWPLLRGRCFIRHARRVCSRDLQHQRHLDQLLRRRLHRDTWPLLRGRCFIRHARRVRSRDLQRQRRLDQLLRRRLQRYRRPLLCGRRDIRGSDYLPRRHVQCARRHDRLMRRRLPCRDAWPLRVLPPGHSQRVNCPSLPRRHVQRERGDQQRLRRPVRGGRLHRRHRRGNLRPVRSVPWCVVRGFMRARLCGMLSAKCARKAVAGLTCVTSILCICIFYLYF